MRKTLAKGGRGDKMAAALMNHIEKERKKLSVLSSSSLMPRSTRRTGEYGVHWPTPAGPSTHFNVEGCLEQWSPTTGPRPGTSPWAGGWGPLAESLRADVPASLRPSAVGGAALHSTLTKILVC